MLKGHKQGIFFSVLILVFCLPIFWFLFQPGFPITDDGTWMVVRLASFHQTLKTGQFPVRFLETLNHGYGYPVLNFLYPLPFYLGEIIHLLGFSFVNSVKILFGLSFLFSGLGMFLFVRQKFGNFAGLIASGLYIYFPYHLYDVFIRGSLGEAVALAVAPFVFWRADKLLQSSKNINNIALLALAIGILIPSHNTLAMLFLLALGIYLLFQSRRPDYLKIFLAGLWGLGISAFFWIPAIFELPLTRAGMIKVADFQKYFLTWENFGQMVGLASVIMFVFVIFVLPLKARQLLKGKQILAMLMIFVLGMFFSLPVSEFLWKNSPLPQFVQFPWRFLSLIAFCFAFVMGILTSKLPKAIGILSVLTFVLVNLLSLNVKYQYFDDSYYSTNDDTTTVKNEYMPKWITVDPLKRSNDEFVNISESNLEMQKVYYPGTVVIVNGKEVKIDYQTNGLVRFDVSKKDEVVIRKFGETPLRLLADAITLASIVLLFIQLILASNIFRAKFSNWHSLNI